MKRRIRCRGTVEGAVLVQPDRVRPFRSTTLSGLFSASEIMVCAGQSAVERGCPRHKGRPRRSAEPIPPSCGSTRTLKLAASVVIALAQAIPEFNHPTRFRQYHLVESERRPRRSLYLRSIFCDSIGAPPGSVIHAKHHCKYLQVRL